MLRAATDGTANNAISDNIVRCLVWHPLDHIG
jgi:hypothetical protein